MSKLEMAYHNYRLAMDRFACEDSTLARMGWRRATWADVQRSKRELEMAGFDAILKGNFTQDLLALLGNEVNGALVRCAR